MAVVTISRITRARALSLIWLLPVAAFLPFCIGILPVMRHDWVLPPHDLMVSIGTMSGWSVDGLGQPVAYPASFLIVVALAAMGAVVGEYTAHLCLMLGIALLVGYGAQAVVLQFRGAMAWTQFAAATFALFNPWTYTELSAGHVFMMLAFGGSLALLAEMLRRDPRPAVLLALVAAIAPQIQFLILAFPAYLYLTIRQRLWSPILAWSCFALPVLVGIIAERKALEGIPLTLDWERSQSILPGAAVLLRGYFAQYDLALPPFTDALEKVVLGIVVFGAIISLRGVSSSIATVAAAALLLAMGLKGPLAIPVEWAFHAVPAAGVFRELYDLIGVAAVCYIALASLASCRFAQISILWGACGLALIGGWLIAPPLRIAVDARALPQSAILHASPNARFVLIPAFQPMMYGDHGSGIDPESGTYQGRTPLNVAYLSYPIDAALGRYMLTRDSSWLGALGVTTIFERARYRTSAEALRGQWALPPSPQLLSTQSTREVHIAGAPMFAEIDGVPRVSTLPSSLAENAVLPIDAAAARGDGIPLAWRSLGTMRPMRASNAAYDASTGWVDARLAFAERPDLAQPYGGALTTNHKAILPISGPTTALVFVEGALIDAKGQVLTRNARWRLISISGKTEGLRCKGLCLVAATGIAREGSPAHVQLSVHALDFQCVMTWLCRATLPPGKLRTVRALMAFDPAWWAWSDRTLVHIRLDGVFNGWLAPPSDVSKPIFLVDRAAIAIASAEAIGLTAYVLLLIRSRWGQNKR